MCLIVCWEVGEGDILDEWHHTSGPRQPCLAQIHRGHSARLSWVIPAIWKQRLYCWAVAWSCDTLQYEYENILRKPKSSWACSYGDAWPILFSETWCLVQSSSTLSSARRGRWSKISMGSASAAMTTNSHIPLFNVFVAAPKRRKFSETIIVLS